MKSKIHSRVFTWAFFVSFFLIIGAVCFALKGSAASLNNSLKNASFEMGLITTPLPPVAACPTGSMLVIDGGQSLCELQNPLVLPSNSTLNCQNLTLVPQKVNGQRKGTGIDPWPSARSSPEVAIVLMDGASNVTVQNCRIDGFDFGIVSINNKQGLFLSRTRPFNRILNNVINSRFVDVTLISTDDTVISDNHLTFGTVGGRGVVLERDSDRNQILRNTIIANFAQTGAVRLPGPSGRLNAVQTSGAAIVVGQLEGSEPVILNTVINKSFRQLTTPIDQDTPGFISPFGVPGFTTNNVIEENWISIPGPDTTDGILLPVVANTSVRNNTILGAANGIRLGIQAGSLGAKTSFGKCSQRLDNNNPRLCIDPNDCFISAFGEQQTVGETCDGNSTRTVNWLSVSNQISENRVQGPFFSGITLAAKDTSVVHNIISGPQKPGPPPPPSSVPAGSAQLGAVSLIGPYALGTTIVARNIVSNAHIALTLQSRFAGLTPLSCNMTSACATCLPAQIWVNDFTDYDIAVETDDAYDLILSILSVNGEGNFWGDRCFDQGKVQSASGPFRDKIKDCFAFAGPVANQSLLPKSCP
jgi:copper-binding protein NosD